jgi:8-oxo-dGTP diphosphatase
MLDFELSEPLELSGIGDGFVNLIYSMALSKALKKPVGLKVSNSILSRAVEGAGLRDSIGARADKHKIADYAEGLIFKAWSDGKLGLEEAVEVLAGCFSGSTDRQRLREESVAAFTELLKFIQRGEGQGRRKPLLTVDCVVEQEDKILLIRRKNPPYEGHWALPGGFIEYWEKAEDAVIREVKEEANVDISVEGLLGVYSEPGRDPRGHVISICYIAKGEGSAQGGSDAGDAKFFDLAEINYEELAFDHEKILEDYRRMKDV